MPALLGQLSEEAYKYMQHLALAINHYTQEGEKKELSWLSNTQAVTTKFSTKFISKCVIEVMKPFNSTWESLLGSGNGIERVYENRHLIIKNFTSQLSKQCNLSFKQIRAAADPKTVANAINVITEKMAPTVEEIKTQITTTATPEAMTTIAKIANTTIAATTTTAAVGTTAVITKAATVGVTTAIANATAAAPVGVTTVIANTTAAVTKFATRGVTMLANFSPAAVTLATRVLNATLTEFTTYNNATDSNYPSNVTTPITGYDLDKGNSSEASWGIGLPIVAVGVVGLTACAGLTIYKRRQTAAAAPEYQSVSQNP